MSLDGLSRNFADIIDIWHTKKYGKTNSLYVYISANMGTIFIFDKKHYDGYVSWRANKAKIINSGSFYKQISFIGCNGNYFVNKLHLLFICNQFCH